MPRFYLPIALAGLGALALAGCDNESAGTLSIASVEPVASDQAARTDVTIRGAGFFRRLVSNVDTSEVESDDRFLASLVSEEGDVITLEEVRYFDDSTLLAVVPAGTPTGWYGLDVSGPSTRGQSSDVMFKVFSDLDLDSVHDDEDDCVDVDGDGLGREGFATSGCQDPAADSDDGDANLCGDTDQDGCEDCSAGSFMPNNDGLDEDGDGICAMADCDDNDSGCELDCQAGTCWADTTCSMRSILTLDNASGDEELLDLPIPVVLNDQRVSYADFAAGGSDLRFRGSDGALLAHEIEDWNPGGTSVVWLRIPILQALQADQQIGMYYGCGDTIAETPSTLWQGHAAVWHLSEALVNGQNTGTAIDASSNGNDGAQRGHEGVPAQLAGGQEMVPNDHLRVPDANSLDITGAITISAWVNLPVLNTGYGAFVSKYELGANLRSYSLYTFDMNPRFVISPDGTDTDIFVSGSQDLSPGVWHHLVGTWDGTSNVDALSLYLDGVQVGQDAGPATPTILSSSIDVQLGCSFFNGGLAQCMHSILDEVRLAPVHRSAAWVNAEYRATSDSLIGYGTPEAQP